MHLHTSRLQLRPVSPADADALFAYRSDADANRFQGWIPQNPDECRSFIERNPPEFDIPDTWFQLAIVLEESSELIGDIGVHFLSEGSRQVELGCTLDKRYQGSGFATEALSGVLAALFTEYDTHRVSASLDPRNRGSMMLMERLGFRREAHFVESLYFRGEWVDDMIYAKLQREWIAESGR